MSNVLSEAIYEGSLISLMSSQLFLIASLFHYYHCDSIFETILIFCGYLSSVCYHYKGGSLMKIIDVWVIRLFSSICVMNSMLYNNYLPFIFTLIAGFFYYMRFSPSNLYHSVCVHTFGFLAIMSIYYNKNEILNV